MYINDDLIERFLDWHQSSYIFIRKMSVKMIYLIIGYDVNRYELKVIECFLDSIIWWNCIDWILLYHTLYIVGICYFQTDYLIRMGPWAFRPSSWIFGNLVKGKLTPSLGISLSLKNWVWSIPLSINMLKYKIINHIKSLTRLYL